MICERLFRVEVLAILITLSILPIQAATAGQAGAIVAPYQGAIRLFLDGQPYCGMVRSGFTMLHKEQFVKAGVRVFAPVSTPSEGFWSATVETSSGVFNYSSVDKLLDGIVSVDPNARIILRTDISAPKWWREQHPNDLVSVRDSDGTIEPLKLPRPDRQGVQKYPGHTVPTWSSPDWQAMTEDAFQHLVLHIQSGPYAAKVIGYLIGSGETHEWFAWGSEVDASPINTTMFRRYLKRKYATDSMLAASWADPGVTFNTAQTPATDQIKNASLGYLRDPSKEQQAIDYQAFASQVEASAILGIASKIKEASSGHTIVGTFYGYEIVAPGIWGHNALTQVLNSKSIDFLVSPLLYWEHRRIETGTPAPMVPTGSVRLHGKLWISETDLATSITPNPDPPMPNIAADIRVQRRNLAWVLPNAVAHWWFDVSGIRYDDPDLMKEITSDVSVAKQALTCNASQVDEVAFVVDEQSTFYHCSDYDNGQISNDFMRRSLDGLFRSGAPVGLYSTCDLARLHDKKVLIFPNLLAPTPQIRREIESLKKDGHTLVFFHAPGIYRDGKLDIGSSSELIGMPLCQVPSQIQTVTLSDATAASLGLPGGLNYGSKHVLTPGIRLSDATDLTASGALPDGGVGFGVRNFKDWTSVYSSAGQLAPALWEAIFRKAGVHIYSTSGDILHASQGCISLNANSAGTKTVTLPRAKHVLEAFTGQDFGVTNKVSLLLDDGQTAILLLH